jgi:menaquinone-dependent protoporphyrinogen oxidase
MRPIRICVATRDGQSARIAQHVGRRLTEQKLRVELQVLPSPSLTPDTLADSALILVVAAVRYGRHLPEAEAFLAEYKTIDAPPPIALASINLTARREERQSDRDNPYLRKIIDRLKLKPVVARAFAGRLDYPRYRWFDRQMIRLIMAMTGGPTDGTSTVEYTRWDEVEKFASAIAELVKGEATNAVRDL